MLPPAQSRHLTLPLTQVSLELLLLTSSLAVTNMFSSSLIVSYVGSIIQMKSCSMCPSAIVFPTQPHLLVVHPGDDVYE